MRFQPCRSASRGWTIGFGHPRRRLVATTIRFSKSSATHANRRSACTRGATSGRCPWAYEASTPRDWRSPSPSSQRCRHLGSLGIDGLAGRGPNNLIHEDHLFRHLVSRQRSPHQSRQLALRGFSPKRSLNDGHDTFPPTLIGDTDNHHVVNGSGLAQDPLDLLWIDLLASSVDAQVASPEQGDGAVARNRSHVSGERPSASLPLYECRGRFRRVLVVGQRDTTGASNSTDDPRTWSHGPVCLLIQYDRPLGSEL